LELFELILINFVFIGYEVSMDNQLK